MEDQLTKAHAAPASRLDRGTGTLTVNSTKWGWDVFWLSAIVAAAFVLRVIYVLQLRSSLYFELHVMDPQYHHEWARAFAAGESFWEGPYFRAPLYPWFLGIIYWLFGPDNPLAPRIVQAVLGSLNCGLLYLIGRQVFSRTVGVIAGFAAATYWVFLYFDAELLIPVLIVFLDLVLLWLLLRARDRRSPLLWGACGLVLGLSAIARPNILLFAPAVVIWIVMLHRPQWRRALEYAFCLFLGCILPIVPITIRNYVVGKDLVLIASQGGVNFFIGNNPHSDGKTAIIEGDPGEWWPCYEAQIARAEQAMGRPLKASEVSRWYFRQALRFMRRQPDRAATLLLRKLGYFWTHWEVRNNRDLGFTTTYYTPVVHYLPHGFWIVGPLGALGLCLILRRAKALFPLWGFVLIYLLTVVMFFITARYRVPAAAVLILLGSHAACWWGHTLRAKRWRPLVFGTLVVMAMGLVTSRTPPRVDKAMLQEHRDTGKALAFHGRLAEAEYMLSEFIKRATAADHPIDAESWYYLGQVRLKQSRFADAAQCFERALELRPHYPDARSSLGHALVGLGRLDDAVKQFEQLVRDDPTDGPAHANLGSGLARLGRVDQAIQHLLRAIEIDASSARALAETAKVLQFEGRAADALRMLRAGVERFPEDMSLTTALIRMLANRPDATARAEAVRLAERACELTRRRDALVLHVTALAYFNTGRLEQAVEAERRALEIATAQEQTTLIDQIRRSLRQYEAAVRRDDQPVGTP